MSSKPKKSARNPSPVIQLAVAVTALATAISKASCAPVALPEVAGAPAPSKSADFTKLDAAGKNLPDAANDFAAVRINSTGLIVAKLPMNRQNQRDAETTCSALQHMGHKDWKLISRLEALNNIWDPKKYNPAYDATFWGWIPTNDWCWTRDAFAGDSDYAWSVSFTYGHSNYDNRDGSGYVLAVRGGARQS